MAAKVSSGRGRKQAAAATSAGSLAAPRNGLTDTDNTANKSGGRRQTAGASGKTDRKDRGLGRPPARDGERVKQDLLQAARQLFLSYEFKAVSVRQIAALAGVNGAMVNYYFGGKKGLYLAMVDEVFRALEQPLEELHRQRHDSVHDFVRAYMQFLAGNPWWPNFIVREVVFGDADIRQSIVAKFSTTFARRLVGAVAAEVADGHYRSDLRPELATWSLMGMMVFPFLSRPIASHLLEEEVSSELMETLIEHTGKLFEQGVLPREKS